MPRPSNGLQDTPCPRCGERQLQWRQGRNSGRHGIGPTVQCAAGGCNWKGRRSDLRAAHPLAPEAKTCHDIAATTYCPQCAPAQEPAQP